VTELRQLTKLLWPFPQSAINDNPSGYGSYVAHSVVEQRLLDVLGGVDTALVQVLRGDTADLHDVVVGCVLRMSATIDGRTVHVEEVGDCESPKNWPHDGARMKDAMSDAYKRCAMRLGVGLHLWAGNAFYLAEKFRRQDEEAATDADPETGEVAA